MNRDWLEALMEYAQLREEIGRLEETGECSCNADEFHKCGLCEQTDGLDQRCRTLINLWADTWAMRLFQGSQGNYVCDDETFPTEATFDNGRIVKIAVDLMSNRPYLEITPKSEYPKPCGICNGVIQSKDDLDWHGYGNCRDIPDAIMKK